VCGEVAEATEEGGMKNYLFDVKLFASVRIDAENEKAAREKLTTLFECASGTVYDTTLDEVITFEASADGQADLIEVDEEPT
jgi:hypothetical protein